MWLRCYAWSTATLEWSAGKTTMRRRDEGRLKLVLLRNTLPISLSLSLSWVDRLLIITSDG